MNNNNTTIEMNILSSDTKEIQLNKIASLKQQMYNGLVASGADETIADRFTKQFCEVLYSAVNGDELIIGLNKFFTDKQSIRVERN